MESPPNVVMVVLDTVRRDRVSSYGYDRETTPTFDSFAADATRFTEPVTQAPWSVPAHASLFTGKYPADHGATTVAPIFDAEPTLPALLSANGYETVAVSHNEYVRPRTGFGRGFDAFHADGRVTVPQPVVDLLAPTVNRVAGSVSIRRPVERAFNAIQGSQNAVAGDGGRREDGVGEPVAEVLTDVAEPFFLFTNFMDGHLPRSPAPEHFDRIVDEDLRAVEVVANERAHLFDDEPLTPESRRKLAQLYDADLRTMDDRLADLLAELERVGVRDDALIVLVSDHGEHLGEFDLVGHQHSVFDPVVSVPLAVQFPGDTGGRVVDEQVEIRRVFHTILDEAGVRTYPERSLASGRGDEHARGAFYSPMMEVGPPLWDGHVEYDPALLGEPISFVRDGDHKLVTFAGDEWLFELPESPRRLREADAASEDYERFSRTPARRA